MTDQTDPNAPKARARKPVPRPDVAALATDAALQPAGAPPDRPVAKADAREMAYGSGEGLRARPAASPSGTGGAGAAPLGAPHVARTVETKLVNLALQGGGAHGAFAWGVIDRLLEDGRIDIDGISATSAGAMNAAVTAYGMMLGGKDGAREALANFWKKISDAGKRYSPIQKTPFDDMLKMFGIKESLAFNMFEAVTHMFSPYQLNPWNLNPLRDTILECVDFNKLREGCGINLRICATNVRTGKPRVFGEHQVTVDAVLASACLPFLFQAVEIEGEAYWDGGYMGNPAIYPLIYHTRTQDIVIVHINPIYRPELPRTAPEIMNRINEISFNSSLIREMRAIAFVTKLIEDGMITEDAQASLRQMRIHSIRADEVMAELSVASKFETDFGFLTGLRDRGREVAERWLHSNYHFVGRQSSIDIRAEYL